MKKILYCIVLNVVMVINFYGQDTTYIISGHIKDLDTKTFLNNCSIHLLNSSIISVSDSLGYFQLKTKNKKNELKITRVGYEAKLIKLNIDKETSIFVGLKQNINLLKEVVVNSSAVEIVSKSASSNILTYDFLNDNILLITYRNNLAKSKLVLLNADFDTLSVINIPEEPVRLFKDCFGDNHIVCENHSYQVYTEADQLKLLPATSIKDFKTILEPCIANDSANLYFVQKYGSKFIPASPTNDFDIISNNHNVNYFYINKFDKRRNYLASIHDDATIKMSNDEDRFLENKRRAGLKTAGDRLFAEKILYKEIVAPLYIMKNMIYIFDYGNGHILTYKSGKQIKSIDFTFHKTLDWKREMIVEEHAARAFAHFVIGGLSELREISLVTGQIEHVTKIPFPFVKEIKAKNDYFYFLYKGQEYDDTRYLSRIKIN